MIVIVAIVSVSVIITQNVVICFFLAGGLELSHLFTKFPMASDT